MSGAMSNDLVYDMKLRRTLRASLRVRSSDRRDRRGHAVATEAGHVWLALPKSDWDRRGVFPYDQSHAERPQLISETDKPWPTSRTG